MRVLVACEFSGIVRDAFIARGHDAVSVDLIPSERPGPDRWKERSRTDPGIAAAMAEQWGDLGDLVIRRCLTASSSVVEC